MTMRSTPAPRSAKGFSLIELLVVIGIMGIIMSIMTPSLRTLMLNQRAKSVSFDVFAALTLAKSEAQKRQSTIYVKAEAAGWSNGWCVLTSDVACSLTAPGAETIQIFDGNPSDVQVDATIKGTATAVNSVMFMRTGRLSTGSQAVEFSIELLDGSVSRCVTVPVTGSAVSEAKKC